MCISIAGNFSVGGSDEMLAHTTETLYLLPFVDKKCRSRHSITFFCKREKENTFWGKNSFHFTPFFILALFSDGTQSQTYMYDGVIIRQI